MRVGDFFLFSSCVSFIGGELPMLDWHQPFVRLKGTKEERISEIVGI